MASIFHMDLGNGFNLGGAILFVVLIIVFSYFDKTEEKEEENLKRIIREALNKND